MDMQISIAQQTAEFLARGGQVSEIPMGVSGEFSPMQKTKVKTPLTSAPCIAGNLTLTEAAKRIGIARSTLNRLIKDGALNCFNLNSAKTKEKFVKESDVIALKKERESNKPINQKQFVNLKQAAQLLGVHPTTVTKYVNAGKLTIERTDVMDNHSKLIKTSAVLSLKNREQKGNK